MKRLVCNALRTESLVLNGLIRIRVTFTHRFKYKIRNFFCPHILKFGGILIGCITQSVVVLHHVHQHAVRCKTKYRSRLRRGVLNVLIALMCYFYFNCTKLNHSKENIQCNILVKLNLINYYTVNIKGVCLCLAQRILFCISVSVSTDELLLLFLSHLTLCEAVITKSLYNYTNSSVRLKQEHCAFTVHACP